MLPPVGAARGTSRRSGGAPFGKAKSCRGAGLNTRADRLRLAGADRQSDRRIRDASKERA
jgi:hypothetical protein